MSGFLTNGVPTIAALTGAETLPVDTNNVAGENPESGAITSLQLGLALQALAETVSHAFVAGSRYYVSYQLGVEQQLTGIAVKIGATGGTNNILVELHNASGELVATSALAGVLAGAAGSFQYVPFTTPYLAQAGTYYLAVQANGTTATYAALAAPGLPLTDGSATGTFGTSAAIVPPTTYTAGLAPAALVY